MANCLVTTLKEVVDNEYLIKIDEIRYSLPGTENAIVTVSPNATPVRFTSGAGDVTSMVISGTGRTAYTTSNSTGDYYVFTGNKTAITVINIQGGSANLVVEDVYESPNLVELFINNTHEDVTLDLAELFSACPLLEVVHFTRRGSIANCAQSDTGIDLSQKPVRDISVKATCSWSGRSTPGTRMKFCQAVNFGNDLDNFLSDMADGTGNITRIYVYGTLTGSADELADINTLKSVCNEFFINGTNMKV